jgi:hypothetical protein
MMLPARFDWPLFIIALLLMAAPVLACGRQIRQVRQRQMAEREATPTI